MKTLLPALALASALTPGVAAASPVAAIMANLRNPEGHLVVVAHRGCHNPAPLHGFEAAPENSIPAIERCASMGVDQVEIDARLTKDGYIVTVHDDSVDRTTNGKGRIADLTLAEIKALRLRQNEGGPDAAITDLQVLTLEEALAVAKKAGITLNVDVKDAIYPQVIAAITQAGAQDMVTLKTRVGIGSRPLAAMAPYDQVPMLVIPQDSDGRGTGIPDIITAQMSGTIKPVGIELPYKLPEASLAAISQRAKKLGVRLWVNILDGEFVPGVGSDRDALRAPDKVWGHLQRQGVSMLLTDEPEAMLAMRNTSAR